MPRMASAAPVYLPLGDGFQVERIAARAGLDAGRQAHTQHAGKQRGALAIALVEVPVQGRPLLPLPGEIATVEGIGDPRHLAAVAPERDGEVIRAIALPQ